MTRRWRIVAVDDDKDILELIRMSLEDDYDVVTFSEPMAAYQAMDMVEPDLVILDIMMPKMTGYQIIEMMKKKPKFEDVPVVFLSAKDANRDVKYGYKLGATIYLTKPFQPDRLQRNIDSLFERTPPGRRAKKHKFDEVMRQLKLNMEYGFDQSAVELAGDPLAMDKELSKRASESEEDQPVNPEPDWVD